MHNILIDVIKKMTNTVMILLVMKTKEHQHPRKNPHQEEVPIINTTKTDVSIYLFTFLYCQHHSFKTYFELEQSSLNNVVIIQCSHYLVHVDPKILPFPVNI